jgi:hypothetical protein
MNVPLAFNPLIQHIPHAVPVVIVWGIMLRFYLAQRKLNRDGKPTTLTAPTADPNARSASGGAVERPAAHRVWVADDTTATSAASGQREPPVLERIQAGRL